MKRDLIMKKKVYNAPFWTMLLITSIYVAFNITLVIAMHLLYSNGSGRPKMGYSFLGWVWQAMLIAETVFYRFVRKNLSKTAYVWLHIITMAIAFVLMPVLFVIITTSFAYTKPAEQYRYYLHNLDIARAYLFYFLLVTGNAFFIATIANIYRKKQASQTSNEQPPGILDGIIDED